MAFGAVKSYIISWEVEGMINENINVFWANDSLFRIGCKWRDAEEFLNEAITGDKSAPQDSIWTLIPDGSITQSLEYQFEFDFPSMIEYNNSKPIIIKRVDEASNNVSYYVCRNVELLSQQSGEGYSYRLHMVKDYNLTFGIRLMYGMKNAEEIKDKSVFVQQGHPTIFKISNNIDQVTREGDIVKTSGVVIDWESQKYLDPKIDNLFLFEKSDNEYISSLWKNVIEDHYGFVDGDPNENPNYVPSWFKYSDFFLSNINIKNIPDITKIDLTAKDIKTVVKTNSGTEGLTSNNIYFNKWGDVLDNYQIKNNISGENTGLYVYNFIDDVTGVNDIYTDSKEILKYKHWLVNGENETDWQSKDKTDNSCLIDLFNDRAEDSLYLWPEEQSNKWRQVKLGKDTNNEDLRSIWLPKNYKKRFMSPIPPPVLMCANKFQSEMDWRIPQKLKDNGIGWGKALTGGNGVAFVVSPLIFKFKDEKGFTKWQRYNYDDSMHYAYGASSSVMYYITADIDYVGSGITSMDYITSWEIQTVGGKPGFVSITWNYNEKGIPKSVTCGVRKPESGGGHEGRTPPGSQQMWCEILIHTKINDITVVYKHHIGAFLYSYNSYAPKQLYVGPGDLAWYPVIPVKEKSIDIKMISSEDNLNVGAIDSFGILDNYLSYYDNINSEYKGTGKIALNIKNSPINITSSIQRTKMSVFNVEDENGYLSGEIIDPEKLISYDSNGNMILNNDIQADLVAIFGSSTFYGLKINNLLYNEEFASETVLTTNVGDDSLSIKTDAYDTYWENYFDYERASREQLRNSDSVRGVSELLSGLFGGMSTILQGSAQMSLGSMFGSYTMLGGANQMLEGLIGGGLKMAGIDITGNMAITNKIKETKEAVSRQADTTRVSETIRPYMYGFFKQTNLKPIIHKVAGHQDVNNTIILKHLLFGWDIQRYIPVNEMINYDNYCWFKGSLDNITPILNKYLANSNLKITGEEIQWFINGFSQGRYVLNNVKGEMDWEKNYQTEYPIIVNQSLKDIITAPFVFWNSDNQSCITQFSSHYEDAYETSSPTLDLKQLTWKQNRDYLKISPTTTSTNYSGEVNIPLIDCPFLTLDDGDYAAAYDLMLSGDLFSFDDVWSPQKQEDFEKHLSSKLNTNNISYYNLNYELTTEDFLNWTLTISGFDFLVKNTISVTAHIELNMVPRVVSDQGSGEPTQISANGITAIVDNGELIPHTC